MRVGALLRFWAIACGLCRFLRAPRPSPPGSPGRATPGPRAVPAHVLGIDSDDAEDQADALTGALRSRVRGAPGWSLQETQHSLGMLTAALRCPQKPDAACLQRIGDQLHTDRFVWGVMSKAPGNQVTAEVHLWARGKPDVGAKETYSDNLEDQNDETLRKIAARILEKISGSPTTGTMTVHAGDAEGVVWINGQKSRALEHGAATIDLAPGRYDVELRAQGFETARQERVVVAAGQETNVPLKLVPAAAASTEQAPRGKPVDVRRVAGWSLIGLGVAAGIVAAVEGVEFLSAKNDLDAATARTSRAAITDVCANSNVVQRRGGERRRARNTTRRASRPHRRRDRRSARGPRGHRRRRRAPHGPPEGPADASRQPRRRGAERPHFQVLPYASARTAVAASTSRSRSEHVVHSVAAGPLPGDPARHAERSAGEEIAARRAVRQLDPLAGAEEVDRVIADHVPAPDGVDPDLGRRARPRPPFATIHEAGAAASIARDLRDAERRAAGRVHLEPMVGLDDLDVELRPQHRDRLRDERAEDVDPDAHVRLPGHGHARGRAIERRLRLVAEAGRAAHDRDACGRGHVSELRRRAR